MTGDRSSFAPGPDTSTAPAPNAPVGGDVGAEMVITIALCLSFALVAGWAGWDILRSGAWSAVLLLVALATAVAVVRGLRPSSGRQGTASGLLLALPSLGIAAAAVTGMVRGIPAGIAWFLNGDHPRHAVYVADTWVQGNLTYAVEAYPHGWHSVLAAAWAVGGAGMDPTSVSRLLQVMALASLLLSAGIALAMAHLGHDLVSRLGLSARSATAAGLLVGSATLLNVFLANYLALGYENSLLAALVVAVCVREALVRPGTTLSLVVCGAGLVVLAHTWQLLLPVVAAAALWCAWESLKARRGTNVALVVGAALVTMILGAPPVLAVVQNVGLGHATEAGPDSPVPLTILALGLGCAVVLASWSRERALIAAAAVTALPSVVAVALAVGLDVHLLHYYPSKLLWQSAMLGLPWIVGAGALMYCTLVTTGAVRTTARRIVIAGVGLFAGYALLLPWGSQAGTWATVDGPRVVAALLTPRGSEAAVVWLGGTPTSDSVTRSLLDVMRVERTRTRAPQARTSVAQECFMLQAAERPVVLSTEPEEAVRERYSCVPDVQVLRVAIRE